MGTDVIMKYFTPEFTAFLSELEKNNNRDWFQANKARYEQHVKNPFYHFINDLIIRISDLEGPIPMEAKDAIFRINRDIRFSKNKSPYKTHMAAFISRYGKKDKGKPALYFQASPTDVRLYSGVYALDKTSLHQLRSHIAAFPKAFQATIDDPVFHHHFKEILGEKNKRIPKEFEEAAEKQPLIYNKNFYFFKKLPAAFLLEEPLINSLSKFYQACKPVRDFLTAGLK